MKILSLDLVAAITAELRKNGKRVVHAHGCFDIPHVGHMLHLAAAKKHGDVLLVTLTPDEFVDKGPGRPVFPVHLRAMAMAALECVDYVAVNRWPTAAEAIELIKPSVFAKGQECRYNKSAGLQVEELAIERCGGQVVFTDEPEYHSTDLLNKVLRYE